MTLFRETADVSVRPAVPGDETAVVDVQLAAWRHTGLLGPAVLDLVDPAAMTAQWARAITTPPAAGYRVLVACRGADVVGVASVAPVPAPEDRPFDAPGGVILALEVAPDSQQRGHGSRLLAAVVDLLRQDGADQVHTWVLDGDEARARFLGGAGLGPDGGTRDLATGAMPDGSEATVTERRWSASI
ncbi:hypothetical protein Cch01nite_26030 [Cellulomonas chitinilytica]|uniref:N-acetyltransferase domain-containing protein n=1 Tax=Cellulomonas chitinilytica TaxID=398759 RepID=A0A919U381_9CELL|nr:GNAT family N-acetyltransferase [Cellulomonas chitinilytica]GIG21879.1 hypothetical protein Cch01nite_26030 [Cellulomonas chitinilytica]